MVALTLARLHKACGHTVSIHCLYAAGPLQTELDREGIPVFVHGPGSKMQTCERLRRACRKLKPDVVHCHNAAATIYGAPAVLMAGVPTIISTRHGQVNRPFLWRQEIKYSIVASILCRRVVAVCSVARQNLLSWVARPAGRLVTILNGAPPAAVSGSDNACAPVGGFNLVNVARLVKEKDHVTLLRAVAIAAREVDDLTLWLIGGGQQEELRGLARELNIDERVVFWGEQKCVGDFLGRAHVFVLPSRTEGLPIALLEAMAAGLPAIVTDVGGMPEIVRLSGAGQVVPRMNPGVLAEAIVNYARKREALDALGKRARECYQQLFTPERMAESYLELYKQAAMS